MDLEFEKKWRDTTEKIAKNFDSSIDLQSILFLIGIQELNLGYQKLSKDQKLDVIHIGICSVFEPYGYYKNRGKDKDGWPHFEIVKELPKLSEKEQEKIIKQAIIDYLSEN
jgi:hypothetical protein